MAALERWRRFTPPTIYRARSVRSGCHGKRFRSSVLSERDLKINKTKNHVASRVTQSLFINVLVMYVAMSSQLIPMGFTSFAQGVSLELTSSIGGACISRRPNLTDVRSIQLSYPSIVEHGVLRIFNPLAACCLAQHPIRPSLLLSFW